jgi:Holliday junction resolvase RusA-like endonuclease
LKILYDVFFNIEPHAQERPRVRVIAKKDGSKPFATVYDPPRSKKFKDAMAVLAVENVVLQGDFVVIDEPMIMSCKILIKRPKSVTREYPEVKPDLSNYIKGVEDALNKIVYTDDSKIVGYTECMKLYSEKPGIHVILYSM